MLAVMPIEIASESRMILAIFHFDIARPTKCRPARRERSGRPAMMRSVDQARLSLTMCAARDAAGTRGPRTYIASMHHIPKPEQHKGDRQYDAERYREGKKEAFAHFMGIEPLAES